MSPAYPRPEFAFCVRLKKGTHRHWYLVLFIHSAKGHSKLDETVTRPSESSHGPALLRSYPQLHSVLDGRKPGVPMQPSRWRGESVTFTQTVPFGREDKSGRHRPQASRVLPGTQCARGDWLVLDAVPWTWPGVPPGKAWPHSTRGPGGSRAGPRVETACASLPPATPSRVVFDAG